MPPKLNIYQIRKETFSVFMSAQLSSSSLNRSCPFIFGEGRTEMTKQDSAPRAAGEECAWYELQATLNPVGVGGRRG